MPRKWLALVALLPALVPLLGAIPAPASAVSGQLFYYGVYCQESGNHPIVAMLVIPGVGLVTARCSGSAYHSSGTYGSHVYTTFPVKYSGFIVGPNPGVVQFGSLGSLQCGSGSISKEFDSGFYYAYFYIDSSYCD